MKKKSKISQSRIKKAWNEGIPWSKLNKEKISIGKKNLFKFVRDKALSDLLARDFAVANLCSKEKLNKPATILYAGVLEALLRYLLKESNTTKFSDLIDKAYTMNFINESNKNKLHVLRDFRNYVHLHEELKGNFELTDGIAQLSKETCESIINGLS